MDIKYKYNRCSQIVRKYNTDREVSMKVQFGIQGHKHKTAASGMYSDNLLPKLLIIRSYTTFIKSIGGLWAVCHNFSIAR